MTGQPGSASQSTRGGAKRVSTSTKYNGGAVYGQQTSIGLMNPSVIVSGPTSTKAKENCGLSMYSVGPTTPVIAGGVDSKLPSQRMQTIMGNSQLS